MANKYFSQFQYTYEKDTVTIYGEFTVGASGAVTAGTVKGGGLESVTKEATAGQYSITLSDFYQRLLYVEAVNVDNANSAWASVCVLEDAAVLQSEFKADKTFKIQFQDYAAAAVNPTATAQIKLKITCRNTTVGPYDA
jgi:hypothetical protein